jgi:hypothetical protein
MPSLVRRLRTALNLWRRKRRLRRLERETVPLAARIVASVTRPTITIGHAKGSAAIIVEETTLLLRRRRSRTYPLHPTPPTSLQAAGRVRHGAKRRCTAGGGNALPWWAS